MKRLFLFLFTCVAIHVRADDPTTTHSLSLDANGRPTTRLDLSAVPGFTPVRNYAAEATSLIAQRITGKTPSAGTMAVFSAINNTTHAYTRNPSVFTGDLDLTCISAATSVGWRITMITPRHGITAHHIGMPNGTVGYWADARNNVYSRTVTAVAPCVGGQSDPQQPNYSDMDIVTLDSVLPASIVPATVLPVNLPGGFNGNGMKGGPVITHNQNGHLCLAALNALRIDTYAAGWLAYNTLSLPPDGSPYSEWRRGVDTPGAQTPAIVGDSSSPYFIVIGGTPVLLGCFYLPGGAGPDPGANAAAVKAVIGSAYSLKVANMPGYPALAQKQFFQVNAPGDVGNLTSAQLDGRLGAFYSVPVLPPNLQIPASVGSPAGATQVQLVDGPTPVLPDGVDYSAMSLADAYYPNGVDDSPLSMSLLFANFMANRTDYGFDLYGSTEEPRLINGQVVFTSSFDPNSPNYGYIAGNLTPPFKAAPNGTIFYLKFLNAQGAQVGNLVVCTVNGAGSQAVSRLWLLLDASSSPPLLQEITLQN